MEHETRRRGERVGKGFERDLSGELVEEGTDVRIQGWEISMPTLEEVLLEKKLF